jgi:hypothetical protein
MLLRAAFKAKATIEAILQHSTVYPNTHFAHARSVHYVLY